MCGTGKSAKGVTSKLKLVFAPTLVQKTEQGIHKSKNHKSTNTSGTNAHIIKNHISWGAVYFSIFPCPNYNSSTVQGSV